ncbi:MAG: class I SAM-dependent methyltransferase [Myxococcales bacterium]|nr:class I SAM-dependent methyltransferase [Myxococcales bacterium]
MDARQWDQRYAGAELLWSAGPNAFVEAELSGVSGGRALDLAAGEGRNAIWLAERGLEVTAVDFSQVALDRGGEIAARRGVQVHFERADVLSYAPQIGAYDVVLLSYLHLPWDGMERVFEIACRALSPGGVLLVIGHDVDNLERGHGGPPDAAVLYRPGQVAQALERRALTVERAEQVERKVQTSTGVARALDALVRARRAA